MLSGVIGAFVARGVPPLEAAALGAHVHGRAGGARPPVGPGGRRPARTGGPGARRGPDGAEGRRHRRRVGGRGRELRCRRGHRTRLAELAPPRPRCTRCPLAATRTQVVFGTGDPDADLMFVGEGPAATRTSRASRSSVVPDSCSTGCWPRRSASPRARSTSPTWSSAGRRTTGTPGPTRSPPAAPTSSRAAGLIAPKVIVTLGNFATRLLLDTDRGITKLRGRGLPDRGRPAGPHLPSGGGPARRRSGAGPDAGRSGPGQAVDRPGFVSAGCGCRPTRPRPPGRPPPPWPCCAFRATSSSCPATWGPARRPSPRASAARWGSRSRSPAPPSPSSVSTGWRPVRPGCGTCCTPTSTASTGWARSPTSDWVNSWRTAGSPWSSGGRRPSRCSAGCTLVELVADPDDESSRTVAVTATGSAWADRWDRLVAALVPWSAPT